MPRVMRFMFSERLIFSLISSSSTLTFSNGMREPIAASVSHAWTLATAGRLPFATKRVYSCSMYWVLRSGKRALPM